MGDYLATAKAFARLTYDSIYIIDYATMQFDYVSDNPLFLCGFTPGEVQQMGYEFYFRNVPEADMRLLDLINECGFDFFNKLPATERDSYYISYDFHLRNEQGKIVLINHKLTPLFLTEDGKMWKAICIVSLSTQQKAGNVCIYKQNGGLFWKLDENVRVWIKAEKPKLTDREVEVLRLYAQGFTINQIAQKLCVVPDTVKYYRRKIFESLHVKSIVEALSCAVSNRII